jgi:hypothetical protein
MGAGGESHLFLATVFLATGRGKTRDRSIFLFEHDLRANASGVRREGKPVSTFPDLLKGPCQPNFSLTIVH